MNRTMKTPDEKAVFRYRLEQVRPLLPSVPAIRINTLHPEIDPELVRNVLRRPCRRYDEKILTELENLAKQTPA
ncbi:hypothetical protein [Hymenobacter lapidiphilus]|uniref:Uncharacterized protein n=1 Tax=Hymenobacter lapidiphilus TaxID=2608003 RepID=A0A7Y7PRX9_9BACT|nr:hypothetical protein [Hymenobacter lapidiphilus]NVO32934.1 hypothetical protein [Hymenobacter lapidiphilus]